MDFYLYAQPFAATMAEIDSGVRLAGTQPDRFQRLLQRVTDYAIVADEGGFEGMCWSEQHFNIEGIPENTTNPILFGAHVGARTSRLKVGQLGLTLTGNHPVRIAEDLAMLDHMTNGRMFCGFTRGNAPRWVNTFGQHFGVTATQSDKSAADELNFRAIQEAWLIIKSAWSKDTFHVDGEFWQVPAKDITWGYEPTALYGQGMRTDGTIEEVGIVPRPMQKSPRVFGPITRRLTTAKFWAREGATAVSYANNDEFLSMASSVLGEEASEAGFGSRPPLAPGAFLILGKDQADVDALRSSYEELFRRFYTLPPFNVPMGRTLIGTPDQVSEQIEQLSSVLPFEEMFIWHDMGAGDERLERNAVDLFVEKVMPRFAS